MPPVDSGQTVVLDASVAVRWVVDEIGSQEAAALLERDLTWIAPRLMLTEIAAALRRKAVEGVLDPSSASQSLDGVIQAVADGVVRLADDEDIVRHAFLLAMSLDHKVPDCIYLALAEREGAAIATADTRLARLAKGRGVPVMAIPHG